MPTPLDSPASPPPRSSGRPTPLAVLGLAIAAMLAACSADPLAPTAGRLGPQVAPFERTYVLESINGFALPATAAEGGGQHYVLLADTLRFTFDGSVDRSQTYRHVSTDPSPRDTVYHSRSTLPYAVDGGQVTIGWRRHCPANALCVGFEEGSITQSTVTVLGQLYWPGGRVPLPARDESLTLTPCTPAQLPPAP